MADPLFHTTTPAARAAGVSEATLRMWARLGIVPFQSTASGVRLFQLADVLRVARERAARRPRHSSGAQGAA